jgi:hypothetical protein
MVHIMKNVNRTGCVSDMALCSCKRDFKQVERFYLVDGGSKSRCHIVK